MKKAFKNFIASLALKTAITSAGAASIWMTYQPKEPAKLREIAKK